MFENPRRGRQARNFTTNAPKILDLESSSEQILPLGAPDERQEKCIIHFILIFYFQLLDTYYANTTEKKGPIIGNFASDGFWGQYL